MHTLVIILTYHLRKFIKIVKNKSLVIIIIIMIVSAFI